MLIMNKIKLSLSAKHINTLIYCFNQISKAPEKERIAKVAKSVLNKTALNFRKRQLVVQYSRNPSKKEKKFTFSLELVEAHFLEQYLLTMANFPLNDYDRNAVNWITSTINKELVNA